MKLESINWKKVTASMAAFMVLPVCLATIAWILESETRFLSPRR